MNRKTDKNHSRPNGGGPHQGRVFRGKKLRTSLPRPEPDWPLPVAKTQDRIAKVMARAGLCSRREAEEWIAAGRVAVNGETIASPALNVGAADAIVVDGRPLPSRERTRLFLYHKPAGLVTTTTDPQGRPTVFDALSKDLPRLVSVGRLDVNSEGLLLLTNDGGLARVLELPETGWLRRYRVRALGRITQAQLDTLRDGVAVDGVHYGSIEAALDREQGANVWLTFAMREGKNREVRNVLGHLGLQVNRLIRVSYGPFQLGELPVGACEAVRTRALRDQLGDRIAALAGADFAAPLIERKPAQEERPAREERPPRREERPRRDDRPHREDRPRGEERPQRRDDRPPRRDDRPSRREERPHREDRPRSARSPQGRDRVPASGDRREQRHDGKPFRQRAERKSVVEGEERKPRRPARKGTGHVWRERPDEAPRGDARLRRKRQADRAQPRDKADEAPRKTRTGLLTDRKGRRILVERTGAAKPEPARGAKPRQWQKRPPPRKPRAR